MIQYNLSETGIKNLQNEPLNSRSLCYLLKLRPNNAHLMDYETIEVGGYKHCPIFASFLILLIVFINKNYLFYVWRKPTKWVGIEDIQENDGSREMLQQ